jgi:hypothetical protein
MADEILNEENRKALDDAFEEYQKAEKAMYRAFVERLPHEQTIILWAKKKEDYYKLAHQFLKGYPG